MLSLIKNINKKFISTTCTNERLLCRTYIHISHKKKMHLTTRALFRRGRLFRQIDCIGNEHIIFRRVLVQCGLSCFQERCLNFSRILRTSFVIRNRLCAFGFAPLCCFRFWNTSLIFTIHFISNHDESEVVWVTWIRLIQKFLPPTVQLVE